MPKQREAPTLVVVDYGAGNLRSVQRALEAVGEEALVTTDPDEVRGARAVILPGVGSANDAMKALRQMGLDQALGEFIASGKPFLGVCVGLQVLFDWSDEGGGVECLGILPGAVRRFSPPADSGLKVPHMGWNTVRFARPHPLFHGIPDETHFYFVHSYYAEPADRSAIVGTTDYTKDFASVVARDNVAAVQFHPEKSADLGLAIYANFARQVHAARPDSRG